MPAPELVECAVVASLRPARQFLIGRPLPQHTLLLVRPRARAAACRGTKPRISFVGGRGGLILLLSPSYKSPDGIRINTETTITSRTRTPNTNTDRIAEPAPYPVI